MYYTRCRRKWEINTKLRRGYATATISYYIVLAYDGQKVNLYVCNDE